MHGLEQDNSKGSNLLLGNMHTLIKDLTIYILYYLRTMYVLYTCTCIYVYILIKPLFPGSLFRASTNCDLSFTGDQLRSCYNLYERGKEPGKGGYCDIYTYTGYIYMYMDLYF